MTSSIRLYGLVEESIVDGPGYRMVIFVQGCPHKCLGCHNPDSHDFNGGTVWSIDEIESRFKRNKLLSGITISGGEPFCQPEQCVEIAKRAHEHGLNVWTYSGFTYEQLLEMAQRDYDSVIKALLDETDVLVDGPFILSERSLDLEFRGSKNQRIIELRKGD